LPTSGGEHGVTGAVDVHQPVPSFPFNTTRNGILFTAAVVLIQDVLVAFLTSGLTHRRTRKDADAAARREIAKALRAAVVAVERAMSDMTAGHRHALHAACDQFRDIANIDLGGHGTERLQDRAAEFVNALQALDEQVGPVGPHDEAARSLLDDFRSTLYAYSCGWRVPHRLRGRPGVLGTRSRHPAGVPPPDLGRS
jgi:hypothetical protein